MVPMVTGRANSQQEQTSALGAAFGGAEYARSLLSCKSR